MPARRWAGTPSARACAPQPFATLRHRTTLSARCCSNLSALIEGYHQHGLPGVYKLDCVDCQIFERGNPATGIKKQPGFAAGVICNARGCQTGPPSDPNCTKCPLVYHMCNKTSCGDKTNWDEQALHLLGLAQPHLISGALRGVWLGDELTASGVGSHPHVPGALSFRDLEKYINLVRGFLDVHVAPARRATGVKEDLILYYMSSVYSKTWPYIPPNLTHFALDDYRKRGSPPVVGISQTF